MRLVKIAANWISDIFPTYYQMMLVKDIRELIKRKLESGDRLSDEDKNAKNLLENCQGKKKKNCFERDASVGTVSPEGRQIWKSD